MGIRKSAERGTTKLPWLEGKHGFSFGRYNDPDNMQFGKLIVFNDDIVAPAKGFGLHPHENAEVVTLVLQGALKHEDSSGNSGIIKAGDVQRMSTGTGIWHSEMNASATESVHLLQIWLEPREMNIPPSYEQKSFLLPKNTLTKIVSGNKNDGVVYVHQHAYFFLGDFSAGEKIIQKAVLKGNGFYVFVISGSIDIDGRVLHKGDSASIRDINEFTIKAMSNSRFLIIETPL